MSSKFRITLAGIYFAFAAVAATGQSSGTVAPYHPLSGRERVQRYWDQSFFSPGLYFGSLGAASGAQLGNEPPEWGQGMRGYSTRVASQFGTFLVQTSIREGSAAALGYDPRYSRCDCKGFLRRTGHAFAWSFITRNNQGRIRPHVPALAGSLGAGVISNFWYPERYSPLQDGLRDGARQAGFQIGVNVLREFGPELKRAFRLRR